MGIVPVSTLIEFEVNRMEACMSYGGEGGQGSYKGKLKNDKN